MKKGFTLIELLIVVSIIGILAVALVPSVADAPKRARDASRKTMVNNVVAAVEAFNLDNGRYPNGNFCIDGDASASADENALIALMGASGAPRSTASGTETAITVPTCTIATAGTYVSYAKVGTGYHVGVRLETTGKGPHTCVATTGCSVAATGDYFAVIR